MLSRDTTKATPKMALNWLKLRVKELVVIKNSLHAINYIVLAIIILLPGPRKKWAIFNLVFMQYVVLLNTGLVLVTELTPLLCNPISIP